MILLYRVPNKTQNESSKDSKRIMFLIFYILLQKEHNMILRNVPKGTLDNSASTSKRNTT